MRPVSRRYRTASDVIASLWKVRQGGRPEQPTRATQGQSQGQGQGWGQGWNQGPLGGVGGGYERGESLQQRLRREEAERQQGLREFQRDLSGRLQREEQQRQRQMRRLQEQVRRDTGAFMDSGGAAAPSGEPWVYRDTDAALAPAGGARDQGGVWTGVPEGDKAPAGSKVVSSNGDIAYQYSY